MVRKRLRARAEASIAEPPIDAWAAGGQSRTPQSYIIDGSQREIQGTMISSASRTMSMIQNGVTPL